jgi:hypothetical protein
MNFSIANTGSSVLAKAGYNILVTCATQTFSANGINFTGVNQTAPLYLPTCPLLVTGAITNAATGTIFFFYDGSVSLS